MNTTPEPKKPKPDSNIGRRKPATSSYVQSNPKKRESPSLKGKTSTETDQTPTTKEPPCLCDDSQKVAGDTTSKESSSVGESKATKSLKTTAKDNSSQGKKNPSKKGGSTKAKGGLTSRNETGGKQKAKAKVLDTNKSVRKEKRLMLSFTPEEMDYLNRRCEMCFDMDLKDYLYCCILNVQPKVGNRFNNPELWRLLLSFQDKIEEFHNTIKFCSEEVQRQIFNSPAIMVYWRKMVHHALKEITLLLKLGGFIGKRTRKKMLPKVSLS